MLTIRSISPSREWTLFMQSRLAGSSAVSSWMSTRVTAGMGMSVCMDVCAYPMELTVGMPSPSMRLSATPSL